MCEDGDEEEMVRYWEDNEGENKDAEGEKMLKSDGDASERKVV